jgi:hypothetical protein
MNRHLPHGGTKTKFYHLQAVKTGRSGGLFQRCNFIDPGCGYVKLVGEDDETLAVAYFERSIIDKHGEGDRITLIRGIRIDPKLNPDAIRRSSRDRLPQESPIAYPDVAAALLCHIVFTSIRYGTQGVSVNCPKADSIEDFYQHYMGLPHHIDPRRAEILSPR